MPEEPTDEAEPKKPFIRGRTFRAYVGFLVIALSLAIIAWDHFYLRREFEALEITGHLLLIGVGFLLIDKKLFTEFKAVVLSRIGKK